MTDILFYYSLLLVLALSAYLIRCSGALYIGLEGTFIWAVFSCFYFLYLNLSVWKVFLAAFLSVSIFLAFFYVLHFSLKINENFVGIIVNTCLLALVELFNRLVFQRKGIMFFKNPFKDLYLYRYFSIYLLIFIYLFVSYVILKTPWGLRLRMTSTPSLWKRERGLGVYCYSLSLFIACAFCISSSALALVVSLSAYTLNLGAGMGWLALFALLLGFNSLLGIVFSCAFLAWALALSYAWQEFLGYYISKSLPYLSCFIAYLILSAWQAHTRLKKGIYKFS